MTRTPMSNDDTPLIVLPHTAAAAGRVVAPETVMSGAQAACRRPALPL